MGLAANMLDYKNDLVVLIIILLYYYYCYFYNIIIISLLQSNLLSKKEIKKKKVFFLCRFLGREHVFFLFFLTVIIFSFFSWSLSWSRACLLLFFSWLLSLSKASFLVFSLINFYLRSSQSIKLRCHLNIFVWGHLMPWRILNKNIVILFRKLVE